MSRVTRYEKVTSHTTNESRHKLWTSHITHTWIKCNTHYPWVMSDIVNPHYERVTSHTHTLWTSDVAHTRLRCIGRGLSYIWMSHVTYMTEARHPDESRHTWWTSHRHTHTPQVARPWAHTYKWSCHTYEWVIAHSWAISRMMNESRHILAPQV